MEIFDPLSPAMLDDPHPVYHRLRETDPVHWHERLQAWILTRHEDCVRVLAEPAAFVNDYRVVGDVVPEEILGLQTLDGPAHAQVRESLFRAMRGVDLTAWLAECEAMEEELLGKVDLDRFDFITEFAEAFTLASMCLYFGVPDFGDPDRYRWATRALVLGMDSGLEPERSRPRTEARQYVAGVLEAWIADPPGPGLLGCIELPDDEELRGHLVNSLRMVFFAGIMSPGSTLHCIARTLVESGALDGDRPLRMTPTAYQELVRHSGGVQVDARACAVDTEVGGRLLRAGDQVLIVPAAANRDPAVFPDPDRLDLARSPNPHLGFGRGVHSCVGARLAVPLHVGLLRRLSEHYRVSLVEPPVPRPTGTLHGLDRMVLQARHR